MFHIGNVKKRQNFKILYSLKNCDSTYCEYVSAFTSIFVHYGYVCALFFRLEIIYM